MSRHDFVGTTTVIDLIQALELLQICADEMADDADDERFLAPSADKRTSLAARALAKRQLDVTQLCRLDLGDDPNATAEPREPSMTLGALVVFRTASRLGLAGVSTARTLDAVYRTARWYLETIPSSLQDRDDKTAFVALMTEDRTSAPPPCAQTRSNSLGPHDALVHPGERTRVVDRCEACGQRRPWRQRERPGATTEGSQ